MNRILDIVEFIFSLIGEGFGFTRTQSSPNPSQGGGLSPNYNSNEYYKTSSIIQGKNSKLSKKANTSKSKLPLLGRGLGRGLSVLVLIILTTAATAQNFPVQVIPQALPPAPIYVSNYADASTVTSPLRVQIILNDFEIANREIRLKTYFTGSGLSFQSNDIVVGASPLFLEGGIPLVLTNVELAPYFEFNNITGINANQYGNAIPEGAYQFCVEVYDVLTGSRLSNKSCAVSVVFQNEPPFLVLPRDKENVDEVNPQYIVFQWTPRSINVSNVEYELSLVEIWDTQVDPQQAFLSSPPVFQTTTSATTYVYGPSDPLLLSGKNYAWRVQAKAKQGTEEIGLFKNEGYSEIYSFSYASSCDLPPALDHEVKGSTNANIFWDDFSTDIPEYTVRYRKTSSGGDNEWFESKTTTNLLTLWDLKAGTTYEYQVNKKCEITVSDWSFSKQFTTFIADDEESVYECGIQPDFSISNQDPLQTIGEKFTAGDFPIKVLEASGSNGRFTGKGYVTIPYLSSIKVGVEFTNVLINTDNQLVEGSVITMYDPSLKNILDIDEAIDTVTDAVDAVGELVGELSDIISDLFKEKEKLLNQIASTEDPNERQNLINKYNLVDITIDQQIEKIKDIENLPEELKNELDDLASEGKLVSNNDLSGAEINSIISNDQQNGERVAEIASMAEDEAEEMNSFLLEILANLQESENNFVYCEKCSEDEVITNEIDGYTYVEKVSKNKWTILKCLKGTYSSNTPTSWLENTQLLSDEKAQEELKQYGINHENLKKGNLWINDNGVRINCNTYLNILCKTATAEDGQKLQNALANCVDSSVNNSSDDVNKILEELNGQVRQNQSIEFVSDGKVYKMNSQGQAELVNNPLTDSQINLGDWTDSNVDLKMRVTFNQNGVLQFTGLGIRNNLAIFENKRARINEISQDIFTKYNAFLLKYAVTSPTLSASSKGIVLDSNSFPDGKKVNIDESASFLKVLSESGGLLVSFLKTAEIEKGVYDESRQIVKAPPIGTGTIEAVGRTMTDITSTAVIISDLVVSEEAREQTISGLSAIKDQIANDPKTLFPILGEVVLEEATGLTSDEISEIKQLGLQKGRAQHLTSHGSVRSAITIFTSSKFLLELPDLARKLATKMSKAKGILNFKNLENISNATEELINEVLTKIQNLPNGGVEFLNDFKDASQEILIRFIEKPSLIDAWSTVSKHVRIRKHLKSLEKVSELLEDSDFMAKLPNGKIDLDAIIDAVKNPLNNGTNVKLVNLSDHLENVRQLVKKHSQAEGFDRLMGDLKNTNFSMQDGASHMLNDLKKFDAGDIKKFDYEFIGDGIECKRCRFDLELKTGSPRFIEYKSWSLENIPKLSTRQMAEYFRSASSLDDIKYIFNKLKTPDIADIKLMFKEIFKNRNKATELFDSLGETKFQQLFGVDNVDDFISDVVPKLDGPSSIYRFISNN